MEEPASQPASQPGPGTLAHRPSGPANGRSLCMVQAEEEEEDAGEGDWRGMWMGPIVGRTRKTPAQKAGCKSLLLRCGDLQRRHNRVPRSSFSSASWEILSLGLSRHTDTHTRARAQYTSDDDVVVTLLVVVGDGGWWQSAQLEIKETKVAHARVDVTLRVDGGSESTQRQARIWMAFPDRRLTK